MRSEISVHWVSRQLEQMLFQHNIHVKPPSPYRPDIFGLATPFLSFLLILLYQTYDFAPPFRACLQTWCPSPQHTLLTKCIKERIWEFHIHRVEFMQVLIFKIPIRAHISHSILNWWIKSDGNHLSVECWDSPDPLLPQQTMINRNRDVFHFMQHERSLKLFPLT